MNAVNFQILLSSKIVLLVDLRENNFKFMVGGEKNKQKSSENDQLTGNFQSFFMPPSFVMGGGTYSITLVRTYIRTYIRTSRTYEKWFPGDIFRIHWCIGFIFHTQVYNHKIQVKFDYG